MVLCVCLYQELDVHNKKRRSDHQYFVNHQLRRPRDLDALTTSKSQSLTTHRAVPSSPPREAEFHRRPAPADLGDHVGPATERLLPVEDFDNPAGGGAEGYEEDSYDNMAGDPTRLTTAHRGKLVTFYRNGDAHYKVSNGRSYCNRHIDALVAWRGGAAGWTCDQDVTRGFDCWSTWSATA